MRKTTKLLVTGCVLLASAYAFTALAGFGDDDAIYGVIDRGPSGTVCICTMVWAPVICTAPDGSKQAFSNRCVAGCNGWSNCARLQVPH
jgi:hypothetical protein